MLPESVQSLVGKRDHNAHGSVTALAAVSPSSALLAAVLVYCVFAPQPRSAVQAVHSDDCPHDFRFHFSSLPTTPPTVPAEAAGRSRLAFVLQRNSYPPRLALRHGAPHPAHVLRMFSVLPNVPHDGHLISDPSEAVNSRALTQAEQGGRAYSLPLNAHLRRSASRRTRGAGRAGGTRSGRSRAPRSRPSRARCPSTARRRGRGLCSGTGGAALRRPSIARCRSLGGEAGQVSPRSRGNPGEPNQLPHRIPLGGRVLIS